MFLGNPCKLTILAMYNSTSFELWYVVLTGKKWATLDNRSTMTQIESFPLLEVQSGDKVHSNGIPFPFRNLQWLQQSSGSLMSCLDSLTYITLGDIASDFSLHFMPPKLLFQILIHLSFSGMDRIKSIMSFLQNNFFQLRICWYTKVSFVPQNSFFVFRESGCFACTDKTLDSIDTRISFLCLFDLDNQIGLKFHASQK